MGTKRHFMNSPIPCSNLETDRRLSILRRPSMKHI